MNSPEQPPLSVLVVDDDEIMRELLQALLEAEGHRITTVGTAMEAQARLASEGFLDVILTDLHLPGTDTGELIETLRRLRHRQEVILGMSGSDPSEEVLVLLDGFLLKPFTTEDFHDALKRTRRSEKTPGETGKVQCAESGSTKQAPVLDMGTYHRFAASMPPSALPALYRMTLDDVQKRAEAAQVAFANSDLKLCRDEGHALKGGCAMVGAMELAALGKAIEAGAPVNTSMLNEIAAASARLRRMLDTLA